MKVIRDNTDSLLIKTDELVDLSWITVLNIIGANELWRHDESRDYEISFRVQNIFVKTTLNLLRFSTCQQIVTGTKKTHCHRDLLNYNPELIITFD